MRLIPATIALLSFAGGPALNASPPRFERLRPPVLGLAIEEDHDDGTYRLVETEGEERTLLTGTLDACEARFLEELRSRHGTGNVNVPLATLGGKQVWDDVLFQCGWRIQENVLTGHFRLLDPEDVRRAWGTQEACRVVFEEARARARLRPRSDRLVVLVHGLGRAKESFGGMKEALEADGFEVADVNYPSTRRGVHEHADALAVLLARMEGVRSVSFVTHSLGGIVVRDLLSRTGAWRDVLDVERLVMIAPPNKGSAIAEALKDWFPYRLATTRVGQDLTPEETGQIPLPTCEFGVIAGGKGGSRGLNPFLAGDNDGVVTVEETRLPGAADFLLVDASHTFIPTKPEVIEATRKFLKTGRFTDGVGAKCTLHLVQPAYRGWLFPEDRSVRLRLFPPLAQDAKFNAVLTGGGHERSVRGEAKSGIDLDLPDLAPGDYDLDVAVGSLAKASTRLHKLSADEASRISAHVDRHGRLVRRGKPFFVRGWHGDGSIESLRKLGGGPFNAVLDASLASRGVDAVREYLAEADRLGIAVILCVDDVKPWTPRAAELEPLVAAIRSSPAALACCTNDELPLERAGGARELHQRLAALDPGHLRLLVHSRRGALAAFGEAADVLGIVCRPGPEPGPGDIAGAFDGAAGELEGARPLLAVLQDHAAGFDEVRAMTYLAIVHGATGILFSGLPDAGSAPDLEERRRTAAMALEEVRALEPVLLEPGGARWPWSDARIHALARESGGKTYLIAVNASTETVRASIRLPFEAASPVDVLHEGRAAGADHGELIDVFAPYGRHVYVLADKGAR